MNKRVKIIIFTGVAIGVIFLFFLTANSGIIGNVWYSSENCVDCGPGGWQKMDYNCGNAVIDKKSFKECLESFDWFARHNNVDSSQINEGYIKIGSMEIMGKPSFWSIKVLIYHQWAVDRNGNLYLLGQLG